MRAQIAALFGAGLCVAACGGDDNATASTGATGTGGASSSSSDVTTVGPSGPVSSSASSASGTSATSSSSGSGSGDPGWAPIPWWNHACELDYATVPANTIAPLTWTACDFGEVGCSKLVKSWVPKPGTYPGIAGAKRSNNGYELSFAQPVDNNDILVFATDSGGTVNAAYRVPAASTECGLSAIGLAESGHWISGTAGNNATYVFQPNGEGPDGARSTTLTRAAQRRDAGDTLLSIEWYATAALEVYDRTQNKSFTIGPTPGSYFSQPRVNDSSVFFMRADAVDDPTAWVWDRADGQFRELIGAGDKVVSDIRGDGQTMVWVETPQAIDGVGFPPGILYTSPFTTDPKAIVKTPRWNDFPVPPSQLSVMGSGYYAAVAEALNQILILRVSDGRRWTIPIPANQFDSFVLNMPYIDDQVLFLSTDTDIHRIDLTALGEGTPE